MRVIDDVVAATDRWQRANRPTAIAYGVVKKFGDDDSNQFVVGLGWYGFVAIYPLLLAVVTILGYVGAASLGHRLVTTLHEFPIVGPEFAPAHGGNTLHGSALGLVIGVAGLLYGAQGVTQTAQQAMVRVWNVPQRDAPGFLQRLIRSLGGLAIIGTAFVVNAVLATFATAGGQSYLVRIPILIGMLAVNAALYLAAFRVLTPVDVTLRSLIPGASLAATGFTLLITLGSGLVQHQVKNSSATYGQFGIVIGLVAFLFLLAKITLYGAELNPVLARSLWPRSLSTVSPTDADERVLRDLAHQKLSRDDQRIGVGFGDSALAQVEQDARSGEPSPAT